MTDENRRFVEEFANPHSWLMMADNLHELAMEIFRRRNSSSITTTINANGEILLKSREIDKSVFLLGGFALKNAIKAFLVYENPSWVSNGHLSRKLKSHSLTSLQRQSKLIPYRTRSVPVLMAFESGLDSWFRYPCSISVQETKNESPLSDHLWDKYEKVMRAYGKRLVTLLKAGWKGPHDTYSSWKIEGESLGYLVPPLHAPIRGNR